MLPYINLAHISELRILSSGSWRRVVEVRRADVSGERMAKFSSETSVLVTRSTRSHISEYNILNYKGIRRKLQKQIAENLLKIYAYVKKYPWRMWGFHGGDYEECRLLGYKNPVRTSQETHYVCTTQSSQLMLCKIWVFHGSYCEECRLLGSRCVALVRNTRATRIISQRTAFFVIQ
jgi:hypothetical protein